MKKILTILFFTFICLSAFCQDIVNAGLAKLQAHDFNAAKTILSKASKLDIYKNQARTWYYLGYTYKELYKKEQNDQKNSTYRDSAYVMLEKAYTMDDSPNKQYRKSITTMLNYLASRYNNDAAMTLNNLLSSQQIDTTKITMAEKNFKIFKSILNFLSPDTTLTSFDKQYDLQLGLIYLNKYEKGSYKDKNDQVLSVQYFNKVLALDPNNISANYSLGILYYNKAVQIINNLNYDTDISSLNKVIDSCAQIFKKALPYMKKAYQLDPTKKATLIGLSGIYYSLNDIDKSNYYKAQLKKLDDNK